MRFPKILISLIFLLSTIILTGCTQVTVNHPTVPQIAQTTSSETVALIADFNKRPFCTGVWVSQSVILTANHCIEGYAEMLHIKDIMMALKEDGAPGFIIPLLTQLAVELEKGDSEPEDALQEHILEIARSLPPHNPDGLSIPYTVQSEVSDDGVAPYKVYHSTAYVRAPHKDLALLHIDLTESVGNHSVAVLADKSPAVGEKIYEVGQTVGTYFNFKDGVVSAYKHNLSHAGLKEFDGPFMQVTAPVTFGDSGSGMFNSDGQLVSICSFIKEESHFGYGIYLETIRSFLQGQHLVPVHLDPMAPDPDLSK